MKKIFNFLKTLLCGILPAIFGSLITFDIMYIINNIESISTGSGWSVVWCFTIAIIELILVVCLLYELGITQINSAKWIAHKREEATNIDSSSEDREICDKATDTSSDKKSNNKCKKS